MKRTLIAPVIFLVFLMTFGVIGNGNCEESNVNLKDLNGIWKPNVNHLNMFLRFNSDSSYGIAYSIKKLDTRPFDKGQVKKDGNQIAFVSLGSPTCKTNIGKYSIKMEDKDIFQLTVNEDPCADRRGIFAPGWIRVKQ